MEILEKLYKESVTFSNATQSQNEKKCVDSFLKHMYVCCSEQGFRQFHKNRDNKKGKCILMNGEISKSGKHTWGMERKGGGLEESGRRFNKTIPLEML